MYGLVAVALYLGDYLKIAWYSGVSLAIFVLYALYVYKMPKAADGGESGEDKLTLKQAVVRFVICAAVLIGASIGMTYLTDMIAEKRYKTSIETFMIGKINILDLNDAQQSKDEAKQKHIQELYDYWNYYYNIRSVTLYDFINNQTLDAEFEKIVRR